MAQPTAKVVHYSWDGERIWSVWFCLNFDVVNQCQLGRIAWLDKVMIHSSFGHEHRYEHPSEQHRLGREVLNEFLECS